MSLFRANVERMSAYVPGEQPPHGAKVIKLNTNENPYGPSPSVGVAVAAELADGGARLRLYSDPAALELRLAASEVTGMPIDQILAGNGSDELLALVVRAVVEPGETILYPSPTYVLYETLAEAQGAKIRTVPFGPDFSLPRDLFAAEAKVIFVTSPNSPSGTSHPAKIIGELADSVPHALVVVDEAYADFADDNALELARTRANVVVLRTFSKSYSLAGMRVGLLFGASELVNGIGKIKDSYNLDRLAIVAAAAALRDQAWMKDNVARIRATRKRLTQGLTELGFDVLPSSANFVFARLGSEERASGAYRFLKEHGVLVRYFPRPLLSDALRITVGTDAEIDELLETLAEYLAA
ncbi:MAG TPA: histidinol-phosphate transaminase [Polyangiaceae bacterium]